MDRITGPAFDEEQVRMFLDHAIDLLEDALPILEAHQFFTLAERIEKFLANEPCCPRCGYGVDCTCTEPMTQTKPTLRELARKGAAERQEAAAMWPPAIDACYTYGGCTDTNCETCTPWGLAPIQPQAKGA